MTFIYVGVGGFLGSCLRYLFSMVFKNLGGAFPLGTLVSNVTAGLFIGFIIGADRQTNLVPPNARLFLTTGLLGGLSTFSTFSLETIDLFSDGKYSLCGLNLLLNLALSFLGVVAGMAVAKAMFQEA